MNRRLFLHSCTAGMISAVLTPSYANEQSHHRVSTSAKNSGKAVFEIIPKESEINIVGPDFPSTKVWGFNGQVPGAPIRIKHGQPLDIAVKNELVEPTAVHWHGIRLANAMDGVAGLTQPAIKPGETFRYQFTPPDAGTFWYHSHVNAYEQVGRGLYGPLIIDETNPPVVDRDLVWMIDDWRLTENASIREDFGAWHDRTHAGRIGNVPTVNGRFRDIVRVRRGERIRLRIINASNARNFALTFEQLNPMVIAIDGQPVKPYQPNEPIVIGVAGRVDVIVDMVGEPAAQSAVVDSFYRDEYNLVKFAYDKQPLRESLLSDSIELEPAALTEPDLANAVKHEISIDGGAMGGLQRAELDGQWLGLREIAQQGYVWAMNEVVGSRLDMPPLMDLKRGQTALLTIQNQTAFPHPMHLHGHHMKLLAIDAQSLTQARWVDSPLLMPNQTMQFAFVADNPGKWLFHCHVLEHHSAGLGSLVRVS